MARRTLYLPVLIVAAVLMGCAPAVLAVSGKAEAAFPGKNGKIAYVRNDGNDYEIYAIDGGGGDKTQLTTTIQETTPLLTRPAARRSPTQVPRVLGTPRSTPSTPVVGVRPHSPATIGTTPILPIRQTARRSSICTTAQTTVSYTRSTCAQGTGCNSPATIERTPILPIRQTARRSSTRAPRVLGTPRSTPSTPVVGGGKIQLTHNNNDEFDPDYSPDGKRIA